MFEYMWSYGGCFTDPCKEGSIGNRLPQRGNPNPNHFMGILVTGVLNNWDHHAGDSGVASGLMLPLVG